MMLPIFAIPVLSLALVAWAVASRRLSSGPPASMVAAILLACGVFTLLRTGGITGDADSDFHWRWTSTRLLRRGACSWPRRRERDERRPAAPPAPAPAPAAAKTPEKTPARRAGRVHWPAFADPSATASFAACGSRPTGRSRRRSRCGAGRSDRAGRPSRCTAICSTRRSSAATTRSSSCYKLTTGEPVWRHRDAARFWESNARRRSARDADAQQRPRLHIRRDRHPERARRRQRRRRLVAQRGVRHRREDPGLGLRELAAGGRRRRHRRRRRHARRLRRRDRQAALVGPAGGGGYSSPHLVTIDGVAQVVLLSGPARSASRRPTARCSGSTRGRATASCSRR